MLTRQEVVALDEAVDVIFKVVEFAGLLFSKLTGVISKRLYLLFVTV